MISKLRKVGNSIGVTIPQLILEQAGFVEGQQVQITSKPGVITIIAEAQVQVGLTLNEAQALINGEQHTNAALTAREKLRDQIEKTTEKKD